MKSDDSNFDTSNITSFHAGAFVELNITPSFSLQPEVLYSSQGAKVEGSDDFKLDYINIPVMARFYILPNRLSIDAGPQFGFLINDSNYGDIDDDFKSKNFDFAVAGGVTVDIFGGLFASGRYVVGLTDTTENAEVKNMTAQLSVGYKF
ncbi:porin family protein [Flavobacterium sp. 3HN19-14]|uniref:porin family protein n=1 Tax=Flavobacterium sp. 3HN19-14 TaxID=3448133 RepID=UPI003EE3BE04